MKKRIHNFIFFLFLLSFCFSQSSLEVIEKFEEKFRTIKSFSANFTQIYYSSSFSTPLKEKGKVYFKTPFSMRWDYFEPERKIFVYFNGEFLLYIPEDNQVIKSSQLKEKFESEILSILTGQSRISQNYEISFAPSIKTKKGNYLLKLMPLKEKEYSFILIEIEKNNWLIKRAVFFDWAGNKQEFIFSNIKENIIISKNLFTLNFPPDVEIIIK